MLGVKLRRWHLLRAKETETQLCSQAVQPKEEKAFLCDA